MLSISRFRGASHRHFKVVGCQVQANTEMLLACRAIACPTTALYNCLRYSTIISHKYAIASPLITARASLNGPPANFRTSNTLTFCTTSNVTDKSDTQEKALGKKKIRHAARIRLDFNEIINPTPTKLARAIKELDRTLERWHVETTDEKHNLLSLVCFMITPKHRLDKLNITATDYHRPTCDNEAFMQIVKAMNSTIFTPITEDVDDPMIADVLFYRLLYFIQSTFSLSTFPKDKYFDLFSSASISTSTNAIPATSKVSSSVEVKWFPRYAKMSGYHRRCLRDTLSSCLSSVIVDNEMAPWKKLNAINNLLIVMQAFKMYIHQDLPSELVTQLLAQLGSTVTQYLDSSDSDLQLAQVPVEVMYLLNRLDDVEFEFKGYFVKPLSEGRSINKSQSCNVELLNIVEMVDHFFANSVTINTVNGLAMIPRIHSLINILAKCRVSYEDLPGAGAHKDYQLMVQRILKEHFRLQESLELPLAAASFHFLMDLAHMSVTLTTSSAADTGDKASLHMLFQVVLLSVKQFIELFNSNYNRSLSDATNSSYPLRNASGFLKYRNEGSRVIWALAILAKKTATFDISGRLLLENELTDFNDYHDTMMDYLTKTVPFMTIDSIHVALTNMKEIGLTLGFKSALYKTLQQRLWQILDSKDHNDVPEVEPHRLIQILKDLRDHDILFSQLTSRLQASILNVVNEGFIKQAYRALHPSRGQSPRVVDKTAPPTVWASRDGSVRDALNIIRLRFNLQKTLESMDPTEQTLKDCFTPLPEDLEALWKDRDRWISPQEQDGNKKKPFSGDHSKKGIKRSGSNEEDKSKNKVNGSSRSSGKATDRDRKQHSGITNASHGAVSQQLTNDDEK